MASMSPTVLLVEDQKSLLRLLQREMEKGGLTVLPATDSDEAVQNCLHHQGPLDVLVADIFLPSPVIRGKAGRSVIYMNGIELARAAKTIRPNIEVVFISGHSQEDIDSLGGLPPGATFLEKPFMPDRLIQVARKLAHKGGPELN